MKTSARYLRLKKELAGLKLDAAIAVSPENVFYMAETYIETQKSLRTRLAIALLPLEQDPVMIACVIERNTVETETWIEDKRYYFEFKESPVAYLAQAIREKGLARSRIGIELDYLSALYFKELCDLLPDAQFIPCVDTFEKLRAVKDASEIKLLAHAARMTVAAFEDSVPLTHPGDTERAFANRITSRMLDFGCDKVDFLMMGVAERSILAHSLPSDTPMRSGEVGRIDFGGLFGNYNSDVARTFTIGKAQQRWKDIFDRVSEVYHAAIDSCRIGVPVYTPYLTAQKFSERLGLPFDRVHEGHGLGIGGHECPILAPSNGNLLFEENMVFCVEHAVHVDGRRFHIEDLVLLTKNGPDILSGDFDPRLIEIL